MAKISVLIVEDIELAKKLFSEHEDITFVALVDAGERDLITNVLEKCQ